MPYCGVNIAAWRATILWLRWVLYREPYDAPEVVRRANIHSAVLAAASHLLPLSWHLEHAGRLSPRWRALKTGRSLSPPRPHRRGLGESRRIR